MASPTASLGRLPDGGGGARRAAREPVLLDVDGPRIGALRRGVVPRGDMECQGDDEGGGSIAGRFVAAAGGTRRRIVGRRERSGVTGINMSIRSSLEDVCAHVSEHDNDSRPGGYGSSVSSSPSSMTNIGSIRSGSVGEVQVGI